MKLLRSLPGCGRAPWTRWQVSNMASRNRVGTFDTGPVRRWYSSVLSSAAYRRVNLRGPTQFRLRFNVDDNDDRGNDFVSFYSGNTTRKVLRPELIVEYRVP